VALLELDDTDVTVYATETGVRGLVKPMTAPLGNISIEDAQVGLGLVALRGTEVLDELRLTLVVRLRVDDVVHLWSEDTEPLAVTVVLDASAHSLRLNLRLQPAGRSARAASRAASFLHTAASGSHLALRLPDGELAPERLALPDELRIEEGLVRLLRLLADVSQLAAVDVPVPELVGQELLKDLIMAQRLLSGRVVRGRWATGELRLRHADLDTLQAALKQATRHELLHVAPMTLHVDDTAVPLGEVQQQFTDAVVESLAVEQDEVVLRVRAYDGSGPMTMTPVRLDPAPIEPRLILAPAAFDELLADLDAPPRHSRLRELL
jgi:hypothetical protein